VYLQYQGNIVSDETSWLDVPHQALLKTKANLNFDMTMNYVGLQGIPDPGPIHFVGGMTAEYDRLSQSSPGAA
jgi:hypothetical protein